MITIPKAVNFGNIKTGLNTVGYTLTNSDGSIKQIRTTNGITEIVAGTGIYGGNITFPDAWSGFIVWDSGDSNPYTAAEDYKDDTSSSGGSSTFNYTYYPTTPIGMVRNLIGDVGPTFALADEEINGMLTMTFGDFFQAAGIACRRLAASQISLSIIRKAGNFMQDMTSIAINLMKLAETYDTLASSVPCDAQAEVIATDFNYNQLLTDKVHRGEPFDSY